AGGADLAGAGLADRGARRVGTHPAGVRAAIAVEDPLVVLGGRERQRTLSIAERKQRQLLAIQELLDDDLLGPEAPIDQQIVECRARLALVGGDDHALARREPV